MTPFDFAGLRKFLAELDAGPFLVVGQTNPDRGIEGVRLILKRKASELFKERIVAALGRYEKDRYLCPLDEGASLRPHDAGVAGRAMVKPEVVDALVAASHEAKSVGLDPNRVALYAFVAHEQGHTAIFIRRQNPFRYLGARFASFVLEGKGVLSEAKKIVVYDDDFDLILWDDKVLVLRQEAWDKVFLTKKQQDDETRHAMEDLAAYFPGNTVDDLVATADRDDSFGARVRSLRRAKRIGKADLPKMRKVIDEFDLGVDASGEFVRLPDDRITRWELLSLIEDSFVYGAMAGDPYHATSKSLWKRRVVTNVVTDDDGLVTHLVGKGTWSPREQAAAMTDIGNENVDYVVRGEHNKLLPISIRNGCLWLGEPGDVERTGPDRLPRFFERLASREALAAATQSGTPPSDTQSANADVSLSHRSTRSGPSESPTVESTVGRRRIGSASNSRIRSRKAGDRPRRKLRVN